MKQVWGAHLSEECAIKLNNVGAVTASHHHIKVHQKLLLLLLIHCRPNSLKEEEGQRLHHSHAITVSSALLVEKGPGIPNPGRAGSPPNMLKNTRESSSALK